MDKDQIKNKERFYIRIQKKNPKKNPKSCCRFPKVH